MTELTLDKLPKSVLAKIDLQTAFMASRCVVAAERLQVFRKLHGKELTAAAIGRKTGIKGWRLDSYLTVLVALGLLRKKGNLYRNSPLADKHYVNERSIYWTRFYPDQCIEEYHAYSVLEQMLTTGKDYETILGKRRKYYVELMKKDPKAAFDFTMMLYYDHQPEAKALAKHLDLRGYQNVLDVGGGSGVMSIALARKNKRMTACVMDIEPVIRVTRKIIRKEKLAGRIKTYVGDMAKHIPGGYDVVMFCDAGRQSVNELKLAYESLPSGGMIVLADPFSSEDGTEPFFRLMWQLRSTGPWMVSRQEAVNRLREAGFKSVRRRRLYKDVWLITGLKK